MPYLSSYFASQERDLSIRSRLVRIPRPSLLGAVGTVRLLGPRAGMYEPEEVSIPEPCGLLRLPRIPFMLCFVLSFYLLRQDLST